MKAKRFHKSHVNGSTSVPATQLDAAYRRIAKAVGKRDERPKNRAERRALAQQKGNPHGH